MNAAVVLNSDTWMIACGWALAIVATAASTLSLLTGTKAEATIGSQLEFGQRLLHGSQAGAAHGVVFGKYRDARLPQRRAVAHHLESLIGEAGTHMEHVGVGCVAQRVGGGKGRKEDGAILLGHGSTRIAAGGADKAEQHVGAVGQQLFGVGGGLRRVVAVVHLAQLEAPAGAVLAAVEGST